MSKSGKSLAKQTLSNILANPVYAGIQSSALAGKRMPGNWPAIVPEVVWVKVQGRLRKGKAPRLSFGAFPLKSALVCGKCGKAITGSNSSGRHGGLYPYYHCPKCGLRARTADVEQALRDRIAGLAKPAGAFTVISSDGGETVKHYLEALGRLATFAEPILAGKIPPEQAANAAKVLEALGDGFLAAIDKANNHQETEKRK